MPDVVGFEDCERTLPELTEELSQARALVNKNAFESALWSCNLMDEAGEWWSPRGESFDQFLARVLRYMSKEDKYTFNKTYNQLRKQGASPSQNEPLATKLLAVFEE